MDEKEQQNLELEQELQWVRYRMQMLKIMEEKLLIMKGIAVQAQEDQLSIEGKQALKIKFSDLTLQVNTLDDESRKIKLLLD